MILILIFVQIISSTDEESEASDDDDDDEETSTTEQIKERLAKPVERVKDFGEKVLANVKDKV